MSSSTSFESGQMEEVKLNDVELERQPMTIGEQSTAGEKNGTVKIKVPEEENTFTGLSKEELLKVALTPKWVRIRWLLLVTFWLAWLGMLIAAIVIIILAPSCKPIPEMSWWNEGPFYQISDLTSFCDSIEDLENKFDYLNDLKVKGLVMGPVHSVAPDQPITLNYKKIETTFGSEEILRVIMKKAEKEDISIILDMTPNYYGASPWFADNSEVITELKEGIKYWMNLGVSGFKIPDLAFASTLTDWSDLRKTIQAERKENQKPTMLMSVAANTPASALPSLVGTSEIDLVMTDLIHPSKTGSQQLDEIESLKDVQSKIGWTFGAIYHRNLASMAPGLARLYHLLLFTLPGTPVFLYGDELALSSEEYTLPKMDWTVDVEPAADTVVDSEVEGNRTHRAAVKRWFKVLSDLRNKERSLLYGDFYKLSYSDTSPCFSFLRVWDQSDRFITAVNLGHGMEALRLPDKSPEGIVLPKKAMVIVSTDDKFPENSVIDLGVINLGPGAGLLLEFSGGA